MSDAVFSDDTILCTAGVDADGAFGAVMPPLYLSANFAFEGYGKPRAHDYRDRVIPHATSWPWQSRHWSRVQAQWSPVRALPPSIWCWRY